MSFSLVSAQKAAFVLKANYFLRSGDGGLGTVYTVYPELGIGLSGLVYREFDNRVLVFSDPGDEIFVLNPDKASIVTRVKPAQNPIYPITYYPTLDGTIFLGRADVGQKPGLFFLTKSNSIITIIEKGKDDELGEDIIEILYSPSSSCLFIIDQDLQQIHKVDESLDLYKNVKQLNLGTASIKQVIIEKGADTIYYVDTGGDLEPGRITWIEDPDGIQQEGSIDIDFEPVGVAWSYSENLLYVAGSSQQLIRAYEWQSDTLTEVATLNFMENGFAGEVLSLHYDPVVDKVYAKVKNFFSGMSAAVYFVHEESEIKRYYDLFIPYDGTTEVTGSVHAESRAEQYVIVDKTIRAYTSHNLVKEYKTSGLEQIDVLLADDFTDESLLAIDGLRLSEYDFNFQSKTVSSSLEGTSGYGNVPVGSTCILSKFFTTTEDPFVLLAYDNGVVLLVGTNFQVKATIQTEDIIIDEKYKINPSGQGPYNISDAEFNQGFSYLYLCFSQGIIEDIETNSTYADSGAIVVYSYDPQIETIDNMDPFAFAESSNLTDSFVSLSINNSLNAILLLSRVGTSSNIKSYKINPEDSRLQLRTSNPLNTSADVGTMKVFNGSTFFLDKDSDELRYLGSSPSADTEVINFEGELTDIETNRKQQFLHVLDYANQRVHSINGIFEHYSTTYLPGKPLRLAYFSNYLYISYERTDLDFELPLLSEGLPAGEATNSLSFQGPINTTINIGDVLKIVTPSQTRYISSLSQASSEDTQVFIKTFQTADGLTTDGDTTVSKYGEGIVRLNQDALEPDSSSNISDPEREVTLGSPGDEFYSLTRDPYILSNIDNEPGFQEIDSGFRIMGRALTYESSKPSFERGEYLYFFDQQDEFYRLNTKYRWVQSIEFQGEFDLYESIILDILELNGLFYFLIVNNPNMYSYEFDRIVGVDKYIYTLKETLKVGLDKEYMVYSQTEGLIRLYFTDGSITRILPT